MTSNFVEWEDTRELYEYVLQRAGAFPTGAVFLDLLAQRIEEVWGERPVPFEPTRHAARIAARIYDSELAIITPPEYSAHLLGTLEGARYRDQLLALIRPTTRANLDVTVATLAHVIILFFATLPPSCFHDAPETFQVRLIDQATGIPQFIQSIMGILGTISSSPHLEPLPRFRTQLALNLEAAKKAPADFRGTPSELVHTYLRCTPLEEIFNLDTPFGIPEHVKYHTAIIAKTRWGKTQLLQTLILEELQKPAPDSIIVLDSTGEMTALIQRLALFDGQLRDRLLIIDPAHAPALNMFDVPKLNSQSEGVREDIEGQLVALFTYIFASSHYSLTGQMELAFIYAVKLAFTIEGATLDTLRKILEDAPKNGFAGSAFHEHIMRMDNHAQEFFQNHFYGAALTGTRRQVARRIYQLISIPAFGRMFTAATNAIDFHTETQERASIILVNTNEFVLTEDSYILFGRYIIARIYAAMLERAPLPVNDRRVTHLIIDEAAPYFDKTFETLLTRVGKYKLKVTVAFQHFDQLRDELRNAVIGQTSVKYIGGLSAKDERRIADDIRCEPEFLSNLKRDGSVKPRWADFAVFADGFTERAVRVRLPFLQLESHPTMTVEQHQALLQRNQARIVPKVPGGVSGPTTAPSVPTAPVSNLKPQLSSTSAPVEPSRSQAPRDTPESGSTW